MSAQTEMRPEVARGGHNEPGWQRVCPLDRLEVGRGVAALFGTSQVALFRVVAAPGDEHVYAIDNIDPFSGAAVLSRGIVGDRGGEPVVASPVYKQAFSLRTGRCLDDPDREVTVYQVRVIDNWVQVEPR
ncbi:MAG TPA: nitrite reductase small subunit NirD [Pseudonocardia sp.]|nr:nitrite reductase small subunit NirD [Pseudonocardia sp.]